MQDFCEKAASISCCDAVSVGTGLEDGVGAGATKARRISSVVAIRMKSWSLTMHRLLHRDRRGKQSDFQHSQHHCTSVSCQFHILCYSFCREAAIILAHLLNLPSIPSWDCNEHSRERHGGLTGLCINGNWKTDDNNYQFIRMVQELNLEEHNSPSLKIPLTVNASRVFCEWRSCL